MIAVAVAVSSGYSHSCGLVSGGNVMCWGHNSNGQLGTGDNLDRASPSPLAIGAGLKKTSHSLIILCSIRDLLR